LASSKHASPIVLIVIRVIFKENLYRLVLTLYRAVDLRVKRNKEFFAHAPEIIKDSLLCGGKQAFFIENA
jgi:hypothetical protein